LPVFECFHFGGHWLDPGVMIAETIRHMAGNSKLPIRKFPWIAAFLGAPFVTFLREALEMRYLWRIPLRLDNTKLVSTIGSEPHTSLEAALGQTLAALGCLPSSDYSTKRPHRPFEP
jgi:hypothetical protein